MLTFFSLACSLCRQDIQERFAGSVLGSLWIFIWPVVQLFIYMIIFGRLMGARLGMSGSAYAYGIYIASGLLCWTCFSNALGRSCRCLVEKRGIIRKVRVSLAVFPTAVCLGELPPFAAGFILLAVVDFCAGWRPGWSWLPLALLGLHIQMALAWGLGMFFACLAVFWRDVCEACAIALQMAFWFTPIVYLPSILPDWLAGIIWINPMSVAAGIYQHIFLLGGALNWFHVLYAFICAHAALALGAWSLRRLQKDMRDAI